MTYGITHTPDGAIILTKYGEVIKLRQLVDEANDLALENRAYAMTMANQQLPPLPVDRVMETDIQSSAVSVQAVSHE